MAGVTIASTGGPAEKPGAVEPGRAPVAGRLVALARAVERSRRRQWEMRQIMLVVGASLMALGIVAIVLGWYGAAHSAYLFQEIPYLISGGLLGVALVAGGGFLFFAAWLVRIIEENRDANARVARTLDRVDRMLGVEADGSTGAGGPSAPSVPGTPGTPGGGGLPPPPPAPAPPSGSGWGTWQ